MRRSVPFAAVLLVLAAPSTSLAWGAAAHSYLMGRAIEMLPAEIRPLFERNRAELVLRVNDPDLWRVAGWPDNPNHFLDLGVEEFGAAPFAALPRDYDAAIEKFGTAVLTRDGLLPWREAEEEGNLRRAFESFARGAPTAAHDVVYFAAIVAHYIQDAFQPLHATNNFDGQLTGQSGVHARFETDLFERFHERLRVSPPPLATVASARDDAFDILIASHARVDALLQADKEATSARATYDDAYFEAFFTKVRPMLEEQLAGAITHTASLIAAAWEQAGRPGVTSEARRPAERVRRPR